MIVEQAGYAGAEPVRIELFSPAKPDLGIPGSVATIEDAQEAGASSKTLYLIQDAHTNASGQMNLARTLELLFQKDRTIRYVFVEAGFGDNSLSFLGRYGSADERSALALPFLRAGELHGEEYFGLTSSRDFTVWGVEDLGLYQRSIEDYRQVSLERERLGSYLSRIQASLDVLKPRIYNPLLQSLDALHTKFAKEEIPLTAYCEALEVHAARLGADMADYPEMRTLKDLRRMEARIDFKKAGAEQLLAIRSLPAADQKELLELAARTQGPSQLSGGEHLPEKAYFALLEERLGRRAAAYPELSAYFEYQAQAKKIRARSLLSEMSALEKELFAAASVTADEATLARAQAVTRLLEKLFKLTLTPEEYREYRALVADFGIDDLTGFLNRKIMEAGSYFERAVFLEAGYEEVVGHAESFYQSTFARDEHFLREALAKMDAEGQDRAVLIAGGFHAPNLKSLLKRKGVGFVSLVPQVLQETNHGRYESILLGQRGMLSRASGAVSVAGASTDRTMTAAAQYLLSPERSATVLGRYITAARAAGLVPPAADPLERAPWRSAASEKEAVTKGARLAKSPEARQEYMDAVQEFAIFMERFPSGLLSMGAADQLENVKLYMRVRAASAAYVQSLFRRGYPPSMIENNIRQDLQSLVMGNDHRTMEMIKVGRDIEDLPTGAKLAWSKYVRWSVLALVIIAIIGVSEHGFRPPALAPKGDPGKEKLEEIKEVPPAPEKEGLVRSLKEASREYKKNRASIQNDLVRLLRIDAGQAVRSFAELEADSREQRRFTPIEFETELRDAVAGEIAGNERVQAELAALIRQKSTASDKKALGHFLSLARGLPAPVSAAAVAELGKGGDSRDAILQVLLRQVNASPEVNRAIEDALKQIADETLDRLQKKFNFFTNEKFFQVKAHILFLSRGDIGSAGADSNFNVSNKTTDLAKIKGDLAHEIGHHMLYAAGVEADDLTVHEFFAELVGASERGHWGNIGGGRSHELATEQYYALEKGLNDAGVRMDIDKAVRAAFDEITKKKPASMQSVVDAVLRASGYPGVSRAQRSEKGDEKVIYVPFKRDGARLASAEKKYPGVKIALEPIAHELSLEIARRIEENPIVSSESDGKWGTVQVRLVVDDTSAMFRPGQGFALRIFAELSDASTAPDPKDRKRYRDEVHVLRTSTKERKDKYVPRKGDAFQIVITGGEVTGPGLATSEAGGLAVAELLEIQSGPLTGNIKPKSLRKKVEGLRVPVILRLQEILGPMGIQLVASMNRSKTSRMSDPLYQRQKELNYQDPYDELGWATVDLLYNETGRTEIFRVPADLEKRLSPDTDAAKLAQTGDGPAASEDIETITTETELRPGDRIDGYTPELADEEDRESIIPRGSYFVVRAVRAGRTETSVYGHWMNAEGRPIWSEVSIGLEHLAHQRAQVTRGPAATDPISPPPAASAPDPDIRLFLSGVVNAQPERADDARIALVLAGGQATIFRLEIDGRRLIARAEGIELIIEKFKEVKAGGSAAAQISLQDAQRLMSELASSVRGHLEATAYADPTRAARVTIDLDVLDNRDFALNIRQLAMKLAGLRADPSTANVIFGLHSTNADLVERARVEWACQADVSNKEGVAGQIRENGRSEQASAVAAIIESIGTELFAETPAGVPTVDLTSDREGLIRGTERPGLRLPMKRLAEGEVSSFIEIDLAIAFGRTGDISSGMPDRLAAAYQTVAHLSAEDFGRHQDSLLRVITGKGLAGVDDAVRILALIELKPLLAGFGARMAFHKMMVRQFAQAA